MPTPWADVATTLLTIIFCAPFLWSLMRYGSHNDVVKALWNSGRISRVKLIAFQLLRRQSERMTTTFTENLNKRET